MKQFAVVFLFLASAYGAPQYLIHPVAIAPSQTQWHSQDVLGQYSYGYSGGPSAKSEVKTLDGVTSGTYSYIDAENKLQTVNYVSDALGFRVAATNLPQDNNVAPQAVEDTAEVKAARAEHLAAHAKESQNSRNSENDDDDTVSVEAPQPVEDTPEVKQAKAEHQRAHDEANARANGEDDDGSNSRAEIPVSNVVAIHSAPLAPIIAHHPIVYHPVVRTVVPAQSFAYSVQTHNNLYPYIITA